MNIGWTELGMHRGKAFRENGNAHRFFDVDFGEFQSDPMSAIERLYAFLDEPLTDDARERMLDWRRNMPVDKHGRHEHDPAALGIDTDALRARFRFYDAAQGARAAA